MNEIGKKINYLDPRTKLKRSVKQPTSPLTMTKASLEKQCNNCAADV